MNLGKIELATYIQYIASKNQPNFTSDEFRDRSYCAGLYQAEDEVGDLVNDIKVIFRAWINSLLRADGSKKIELTRGDDRFISFNYTSTLQNLYGIPDSEILYIHGKTSDEVLVLGHNKTHEELIKAAEVVQPEPPADLPKEKLTEWYDGEDYIAQTVRDTAANEMYRIRKSIE